MRSLIARVGTGPLIGRGGAKPLVASRQAPPAAPHIPADPAPSKLRYRITRLWLTPAFRKVLHVGTPLMALFACVTWYASDPARVSAITDAAYEIRREIEDRPEFRVNVLGIDGAGPQVTEEVRAALALDLPMSSFDLDLEDLRARLEALPAIRSADLRVQSGGYLAVRIDERLPAALWLTHEELSVVDREGHFIGGFGTRDLDRPLPVIAGEGADLVVPEALQLFAIARPLGDRLQGLVRMGERRWDVVLTDGSRILLPEIGADSALNRILAMQDVGDILDRDVTIVDVRNPARLTVRLTEPALDELRRIRELALEQRNGDTAG